MSAHGHRMVYSIFVQLNHQPNIFGDVGQLFIDVRIIRKFFVSTGDHVHRAAGRRRWLSRSSVDAHVCADAVAGRGDDVGFHHLDRYGR